MSRKPGRPEGAKNKTYIQSVLIKSRCKCGSTDKTEYSRVTAEMWREGIENGQPYNVIRWRATTCAACGQARVDRCPEMTADESPGSGTPPAGRSGETMH